MGCGQWRLLRRIPDFPSNELTRNLIDFFVGGVGTKPKKGAPPTKNGPIKSLSVQDLDCSTDNLAAEQNHVIANNPGVI